MGRVGACRPTALAGLVTVATLVAAVCIDGAMLRGGRGLDSIDVGDMDMTELYSNEDWEGPTAHGNLDLVEQAEPETKETREEALSKAGVDSDGDGSPVLTDNSATGNDAATPNDTNDKPLGGSDSGNATEPLASTNDDALLNDDGSIASGNTTDKYAPDGASPEDSVVVTINVSNTTEASGSDSAGSANATADSTSEEIPSAAGNATSESTDGSDASDAESAASNATAAATTPDNNATAEAAPNVTGSDAGDQGTVATDNAGAGNGTSADDDSGGGSDSEEEGSGEVGEPDAEVTLQGTNDTLHPTPIHAEKETPLNDSKAANPNVTETAGDSKAASSNVTETADMSNATRVEGNSTDVITNATDASANSTLDSVPVASTGNNTSPAPGNDTRCAPAEAKPMLDQEEEKKLEEDITKKKLKHKERFEPAEDEEMAEPEVHYKSDESSVAVSGDNSTYHFEKKDLCNGTCDPQLLDGSRVTVEKDGALVTVGLKTVKSSAGPKNSTSVVVDKSVEAGPVNGTGPDAGNATALAGHDQKEMNCTTVGDVTDCVSTVPPTKPKPQPEAVPVVNVTEANIEPKAKELITSVVVSAPVNHSVEAWSYDDASGQGPAAWSGLSFPFQQCANTSGNMQSPVDVMEGALLQDTIFSSEDQAVFGMKTNYSSAAVGGLMSTGQALSVVYTHKSSAGRLVHAGIAYDLVRIDVHSPAEHTQLGERAMMEIQLVHSPAHPSEIQSNDMPMFTVVSIMVRDVNTTNEDLMDFISSLPMKPNAAKPHDKYDRYKMDLNKIFGDSLESSYYTYMGSWTSPPCYKNVRWYIMGRPIDASEELAREFSSHLDEETQKSGNARPVMPLNGRPVYHVEPRA